MIKFEKSVDRRDTDSMKYDGVEDLYNVKDVIPMWVADMDFAAPQEVISALKLKVEHGIFGYPGNTFKYYEAVVNWMKRRHNWEISEDWIFPAPGVVPAITAILEEITQPNDKVIIQSPVYHHFYNMVHKVGCEVVDSPLVERNGKYEMDFEGLERLICNNVKAFVLCSPHNPVGRVWSKKELQKLGELCLKHNVTVISDEIHNDLVFKPNKHTIFTEVDPQFVDNTIICTAPSKTFNLAGLQTANIIVPGENLRKIVGEKFSKVYNSFPNTMGIEATKAVYKYGDSWLDELLDYVERNIDYLQEYIEDKMPQIKLIRPQGTYLVWLDMKEVDTKGLSAFEFTLQNAKVVAEPGEKYGGPSSSIRLNLACHKKTLEKALKQLSSALQSK
ncbi:MalY/PatB family protein [Proteinivorax hydrogeniformans]|uniref:cysteine-S-conjugate beta-lyase n=1 Tax=Proteinivorax hydrogeniformans TaxID=1826727 RepID=A0AAU8HSY4_9FIRM